MNTFTYAVSYEYDLRPVQTLKGEVKSSHERQAARLALKSARSALKPRGWRSVVVVLERGDPGEGGE